VSRAPAERVAVGGTCWETQGDARQKPEGGIAKVNDPSVGAMQCNHAEACARNVKVLCMCEAGARRWAWIYSELARGGGGGGGGVVCGGGGGGGGGGLGRSAVAGTLQGQQAIALGHIWKQPSKV